MMIAIVLNTDLLQAFLLCQLCASAFRGGCVLRPGPHSPLPGRPRHLPRLGAGGSLGRATTSPGGPLSVATPPAVASPGRHPRAASLGALGEQPPLAERRRGEAATLPLPPGQAPVFGLPPPGAKFKKLTGAAGWLRKRNQSRLAGRPLGPAGPSARRATRNRPSSATSRQAAARPRTPRAETSGCRAPRRRAWAPGGGGRHGGPRGPQGWRWRPATRVSASR